jgi:histidinol dehydrogenase
VGLISRELAEAMLREMEQQLKSLPTADVARPAWSTRDVIVVHRRDGHDRRPRCGKVSAGALQ